MSVPARRGCVRGYLYARYVRARYLLRGRGARVLAGAAALLLLGSVLESARARGGASEAARPSANTSLGWAPQPLRRPAAACDVAILMPSTSTSLGRGPGSVPAPSAAPDVAILMLACNRMQETTFNLSLWSHVRGISRAPFYVSINCSPGITLNEDEWRA